MKFRAEYSTSTIRWGVWADAASLRRTMQVFFDTRSWSFQTRSGIQSSVVGINRAHTIWLEDKSRRCIIP